MLVGCGFTGVSAFFQLVDWFPVREITIFEASADFGPGYPYKLDETSAYLLNNAVETMCLTPASRRAFADWLESKQGFSPSQQKSRYVSRSLFGAFLHDAYKAALTTAAVKGVRVRQIPHEAIDMWEENSGGVMVAWRSGVVHADVALLTIGRAPQIASDLPKSYGPALYIADHVGAPELDDLPLDARVHVLGASLSAYDVVNRMFSSSSGCGFDRNARGEVSFRAGTNRRHVTIGSRSGRLKKVQSSVPANLRRRHFTLSNMRRAAGQHGLTLKGVADLIMKEAEAHDVDVAKMMVATLDPYADCSDGEAVNARACAQLERDTAAARAGGVENFLVDLFDDAQLEIWDAFGERLLGHSEEALYRQEYESAALTFAAPCPVDTAERLLALLRAGRLRILNGVAGVSPSHDGASFDVPHSFGVEKARILIDATGRVERDVTHSRQPTLVKRLVARGLMRPYTRNGAVAAGAAVDMSSFRLLGARDIYLASMLLWGPGFYTSSAFMMATLVERILGAWLLRGDMLPE